jgi:hypothetical protein
MSMPDIPDDPDQAAYNQAHPLKTTLPASTPQDYPAPSNDAMLRGLAVSRAAWDVKNPTANQSQADMGPQGSGTGPSSVPVLNSVYGSQPQGDTTQTQKPAPGSVSPYDVEIPKNPSAAALKKIAGNVGFDTSKISDSYWDNLSQHYSNVENPGTLRSLQQWIQASGLGHFMQGADAGSPTESPIMDGMPYAETKKADQFFNEHIQSRIIDGGKYIDGNGNYQPPASYKTGSVLGSLITNPAGAAGLLNSSALTAMSATGKAMDTLKPAINGTMGYMAAHPAVAKVLQQSLKYSAIGYAINRLSGGKMFAAPIPIPE